MRVSQLPHHCKMPNPDRWRVRQRYRNILYLCGCARFWEIYAIGGYMDVFYEWNEVTDPIAWLERPMTEALNATR